MPHPIIQYTNIERGDIETNIKHYFGRIGEDAHNYIQQILRGNQFEAYYFQREPTEHRDCLALAGFKRHSVIDRERNIKCHTIARLRYYRLKWVHKFIFEITYINYFSRYTIRINPIDIILSREIKWYYREKRIHARLHTKYIREHVPQQVEGHPGKLLWITISQEEEPNCVWGLSGPVKPPKLERPLEALIEELDEIERDRELSIDLQTGLPLIPE